MPDSPWIQMNEKVRRRTVAAGEKMHQVYVILQPGGKVAEHTHHNEQIAACLSGRLRLIVEGKPIELGPGESFLLRSNVPHAAQVEVETHVLDTFSPPREDMLKQDREASK